MDTNRPVLCIPDTQTPFEATKALEFCIYLKKHYRIPDENCCHLGDEIDAYFGSVFKKDPDARHTPNSELTETIDKMKHWYDAFPQMKLCTSNHGQRWAKKACEAEIPSVMLRSYQELIVAPPGWQWKQSWVFSQFRKPFRITHGCGYSGAMGHRNAAIDAGISNAIGHLHSYPGINYIKTERLDIWAANFGCLINAQEYAFHYGKDNRFKPGLGAGIIFNSGTTPIFVPYE